MRRNAIIALSIFLLTGLFFSRGEVFHCNFLFSNYDAEKLTLKDTIELKYSDLYYNSAHDLRLSFDSISEERCPSGAVCVWKAKPEINQDYQLDDYTLLLLISD